MSRRRYDPDDAEQVGERQQTAELQRAQLKADIDWLIASPQGRRLVSHLCSLGGMLSTPYVMGDPHGSAFSAGRHSLALDVYGTVTRIGDAASIALLMDEVFVGRSRTNPH